MPFEDGQKYAAECISAELTQSQNGTEGIELLFRAGEGTTPYTLWLTEQNRQQVNRVLENLGADPSNFDPLDGDLSMLVGAHCTLTMGSQEYMGKTRMRVRWIDPPKASVKLERVAAYFSGGRKKR
jgi:hypothetical protein